MVTTKIAIISKEMMAKAELLVSDLILTFSIAQVGAKMVNGCKRLFRSLFPGRPQGIAPKKFFWIVL